MKRSGRRRVRAGKLVLGLLAAACLLVGATSLWAADGPRYTAWSEPVNVGPGVNTTFNEQGPALSTDGLSLYFHRRQGSVSGGNDDIWVSQRASVDDAWGPAVNLGPTFNSSVRDFAPTLSKDSHWLFFSSSVRRARSVGHLGVVASGHPRRLWLADADQPWREREQASNDHRRAATSRTAVAGSPSCSSRATAPADSGATTCT